MKYFDLFTDYESLIDQWNGIQDAPTDEQILFAIYSYEEYSGEAFCLFIRDEKLFEVHDAHCSCYGLENWKPEETSWKALANYKLDYSGEAGLEIKRLIGVGLQNENN